MKFLSIFLVFFSLNSFAIDECEVTKLDNGDYIVRHPDEEFPRWFQLEDEFNKHGEKMVISSLRNYKPKDPTPMFLCPVKELLYYNHSSVTITRSSLLKYEENFLCSPRYLQFFQDPQMHTFECSIDLELFTN